VSDDKPSSAKKADWKSAAELSENEKAQKKWKSVGDTKKPAAKKADWKYND